MSEYWKRAKILSKLEEGGVDSLFESGFTLDHVNPDDEELYYFVEKIGVLWEDYRRCERKLWLCAQGELDTPEPV